MIRWRVHKWLAGQIWPTAWFCKYFNRTQPHLFVHISSMAAFLLQRHDWMFVKVTKWLTSLKYLLFGLFYRKVYRPPPAYSITQVSFSLNLLDLRKKLQVQIYHFGVPASYFYLPFEQSFSTSAVESICKFHVKHHRHHFSHS